MLDFLFVLGQFVCLSGLLYGLSTVFLNWSASGQFWGDVDPILPREVQPIAARLNCTDEVDTDDGHGGHPYRLTKDYAG
jgi:hypothetical protein